MNTKFSIDNARLAIKGLVTAWVPIAVALGVIHDTQVAVLIMGASTVSVDLVFRVFGVGDPATIAKSPEA